MGGAGAGRIGFILTDSVTGLGTRRLMSSKFLISLSIAECWWLAIGRGGRGQFPLIGMGCDISTRFKSTLNLIFRLSDWDLMDARLAFCFTRLLMIALRVLTIQ